MSVYYIKATVGVGDINIALDATTEISEGFVADLPSFKLEDGTEGSDHHTLKAPVISFKGILSDTKSLSSGFRNSDGSQNTEKSRTEDGALRWRSVKDNKEALIFIYKNHLPLSIFTDQTIYADCYITGLGFTQNSRHGVISGKSSLEVSIVVKQPVRGARAQAIAERDLGAVKAYQAKASETGAKKNIIKEEDNLLCTNAREKSLVFGDDLCFTLGQTEGSGSGIFKEEGRTLNASELNTNIKNGSIIFEAISNL